MANEIATRISFLQQKQSYRISDHVRFARLYGNSNLLGVSGMSPAMMLAFGEGYRDQVKDSITQSVVDTVVAQVGENKPRPYFLTSGGTYKQQRKAKRLNWFCEGIFYENDAYSLGGDAQRDGEVFGDGLIYIHEKNKRVCWERILSSEFWVDEAEGALEQPREGFFVRAIDREKLAAEYPKKRAEIMRAQRANLQEYGVAGSHADMIWVRRAWHLRSGPEAKDGRYVVSIPGQASYGLVLEDKEWKHDFFPVARFRGMTRPMGYWCQGVAERLQGKHLEVNKLLAIIQRSFHMAGTYKVFLQDGSKIVKEHVNNQIGAIVTYRGTEPKYFVPNVVPMEYYAHLKTLKDDCYESEGVSRLSAAGIKPAGLDSGEAQRTYRDTVQLRMKTRERNNETAYVECAYISICVARDIAERDGSYVVEYPQGKSLREVSMTAEELDPSDHSSQCFPTSSLPKDPAGRLATIQNYIQAGFMTPRQGRKALDFPDLEAIESLANAEEDLLTKILDDICDGVKYRPPEPTDDIQLAKELVVEYINRGRMQDLEEDRLDELRDWSAQVDDLIAAATPPPMAGGPGIGPPQAAPMPTPQSNLVPNVPQGA